MVTFDGFNTITICFPSRLQPKQSRYEYNTFANTLLADSCVKLCLTTCQNTES